MQKDRAAPERLRSEPMGSRFLAVSLVLLVLGCARSEAGASAGGALLPPDWDTSSPARFELLIEREFPDDGLERELDAASLDALTAALQLLELPPDGSATREPADVQRALRAVLLLARSRDTRGPAHLLAQLAARRTHPGRADDAADCVAAAHLGTLGDHPNAASFAMALGALSEGDSAHPDLEVATECALAALALGDRGRIPFLLRLARIGTPSAERDGRLTDSPTTAWIRGRAVDALRTDIGLPLEPFTDLSAAQREAIVDGLERGFQTD